MDKKTEALRLALEALDCIYSPLHVREINKVGAAMSAIREALAEQPAQQKEPVAWVVKMPGGYHDCEYDLDALNKVPHGTMLYAALPARKPLTEADLGVYISKELAEYIDGAYADIGCAKDQLICFARTIEAAHGIKEN